MTEDELLKRITTNPDISGAKPIIHGRRLWPWNMAWACSRQGTRPPM